MQRAMLLPQLLLAFLMIFSDQVNAKARWFLPYPMNSSLLHTDDGRENGTDHFAIYMSNTTPKSVLTGGMATFDVYGMQNLKNQVSSSVIWVINQRGADYSTGNAAIAGWTVDPSEYGDSRTHFFTLWTADGFISTGCNNLACDGFVPVNYAPITPGDILEPTDGQLKIAIKIFKNKDDGDWWLHFGYDNKNLSPVGYWPKSIFNNLVDHANSIQWGGYTQSFPGDGSPTMGNGQRPGKDSASVRDIKYVDTSGQGSPWAAGIRGFQSHKRCYEISPFIDDMFYYGGPGGCTM